MKQKANNRKQCLVILVLAMLILTLSGTGLMTTAVRTEAAQKKTGFIKKNGSWYYYDQKGKLAKGWYKTSSGHMYYFGKTGAAKAGILSISGKKYCFNEKGKMLTTWQTVNGKNYFFDEKKGYMYTGWITTTAGNKYYFWKDGVIRSGFRKVGNKIYCFSDKGKMLKNCFAKKGKATYYLKSNGTLAKGRLKIQKYWYSFHRETGELVRKGWYKETDGSYYYAASNGRLVKGFYKPDSYYRYFRSSDCKLMTGWQEIDGYKYYFKEKNGIRYDNCFLKDKSGNRYYFNSNGKLVVKKWVKKSSSYYYSQADGTLASGWLTLGGNKYYLNPSTCVRETGWVTVDGEKYYLDPATGILAQNQWVGTDYVGEDGAMIPEYHKVSFRWPLNSGYNYISSYFGNRESPGGIGSTNHNGIDIPAPTGTPIYAADSGTVITMQKPSESGGAGYYTKIDHGKGFVTEYMHQSKFHPKVKVGTKVTKGQIIGYVGSTGNSTGPHLHFGVIANGTNQNPLNYVKRPS